MHYTLLLILSASGAIPLRYVTFLNYADERILLRRIGGAYEFIHITLRDYFAELEDEPEAATE